MLTTDKEYKMTGEFNEFFARIRSVELGDMRLRCVPDNTILYLHHPDRSKEYDHFWRQLGEEERPEEFRGAGNYGAFITRHVLGEDAFEELANRVSESCNFRVVYSPDPTEVDKQAIDEQMESIFHLEMDDIDPDDFLD
jgi:hypothetical protein